MYGLVNKAIRDMVCDRFGEDSWNQIKQKAECQVDTFLSMEPYPDDLTHRLVKAASEILGLSTAEIMQAFGQYWVEYTAQEGYGELMDMSGDTLTEFLQNLDDLHARVGMYFPQLKPPSFACTDLSENSMNLHYRSTRKGLTPMVVGLLKGLGIRFKIIIKISQIQSRENGADSDVFSIKYKSN
ncbi:MAG TPA: heme NO-binding protein [Cyanobacteria bacterium UBA11372]|nr:heme NO-binding protein [Cyanobacteria bacterium UBA11372]